MCDNATAMSYVNYMCEKKLKTRYDIAMKIWEFAIKYGLWISAAHIPGNNGIGADK